MRDEASGGAARSQRSPWLTLTALRPRQKPADDTASHAVCVYLRICLVLRAHACDVLHPKQPCSLVPTTGLGDKGKTVIFENADKARATPSRTRDRRRQRNLQERLLGRLSAARGCRGRAQAVRALTTSASVPRPARDLAAKAVEGAALALEGIHDVHGSHRLAARVLGVGHRVTDHVLEEHC